MTRENGTLAAVRKAERLKGRRTACVLGKNPAATAAIGGMDTDNRGMDGENGYPEASAKEAASRTGRERGMMPDKQPEHGGPTGRAQESGRIRAGMTEIQKRTLIGCACAVSCETLFGLSYLFTKKITSDVDAVTLLGWRFLLAFIMMNILLATGYININIKKKHLPSLLKIAFLQPIAYFSCETFGIQMTTASESGAIIASIPIASLAASILFLHKKPTRFQTFGICLTVLGVVVCVIAKGFESSFNGIGYIMLCMAVLSYSLYCVSAEKAYAITNIEKTYAMIACGACFFTTMAIGMSIAAGTAVDWFMLPFQNTEFLFSVIYLGIASSVLSFLLFNMSISYIGTNKASSFVGISTAVSILAGVFVLDEDFSAMQCYGTLIILLGVYIANMKSGLLKR